MKSRTHTLAAALLIITGIVLSSFTGFGQAAKWKFPIKCRDKGGKQDSIWLGYHPDASDTTDNALHTFGSPCDSLRDSELPPIPNFPGVYDFRWYYSGGDPNINAMYGDRGGGQGVKYMIRKSPAAAAETLYLYWQQSLTTKDTVWISWPSNLSSFCDSARFLDGSTGGLIINASMTKQSSVIIPKQKVGIPPNTGIIYIYGVKSFTSYITTPPTLLSPSDAQKNVDVGTVFNWSSAANATSYILQVATDPSFVTANLVVNTKVLDTTYTAALQLNNKYYWRVSGMSSYYTSCNAAAFSFTTSPIAPTLVSPKNKATNIPLTSYMVWNSSPAADSYEIQYSIDKFANVLKDTIVAIDSVHLPLSNCGTYYWKVRSISGSFKSAYSDSFSFGTAQTKPDVPALVSPADNATGVDGKPTLSYVGDLCTATFTIQVATDTSFTDTVFVKSGVSATSTQVSQLYGQTDYYWRVRAVSAGGASDYSRWRKFTTTVVAPTAPTLVSPANNATVADLAPTLTWAKPHNFPVTYHLQVDTNKNFTKPFVDDSTITDTTKQLSALVNCNQYYWRVCGKNTAGIGPYSATGAFYTPSLPPQTPTLVDPPDGQSHVISQPTLAWSSDDFCSKKFLLVVKTDTLAAPEVRHDTLAGLSKQIGPLAGETDYFWHVASLSQDGLLISAFTPWRKFTTDTLLPSTPVLVSPLNGFSSLVNDITFIWNKSTNKPKTYRLQISLVNTFATLYYDNATLTDTTITLSTIMHCDQYFWRVSASNGAGTTIYSTVRNFNSVHAVPGSPLLLEPAQGKDSVSFLPLFKWQPVDSCMQKYVLLLSTDINFNTIVAADTTTGTSFQYSGAFLKLFTWYYWKVTARNDLGDGVSIIDSFRTTRLTPPDMPFLISPPNNNANTVLNPLMVWHTSPRDSTYRLQIALDTEFTIIMFNDSTITDTSKQISDNVLPYNKTFFWRVNAKNAKGTSAWSEIWKFTTLAPPTAPTLITPANNATFVTTLPNFIWSIPDGAVTYEIQIATDTSFSHVVIDNSVLTINNFQPESTLQARKMFYWQVRGKNQAGNGPWSARFKFTTTPTSPANWLTPLSVAETGPARDIVYFGFSPQATYGIDPLQGEFMLPPISSGEFDVRFVDMDSRPGLLGEGVRVNQYHFYSYLQLDTFRLAFQPGIGTYPITIKWDKSMIQDVTDTTWILDDFGKTFNVIMNNADSLIITNSRITSALIIVKHVFPVGVIETPPSPFVSGALPKGYQLYQNYPNPFNPTTTISFSTEHTADVRLAVYDVLGREISLLAQGSYAPGIYQFRWDGKNDQGMQMPTGVYYARIIMNGTGTDAGKADQYVFARKMLMIK